MSIYWFCVYVWFVFIFSWCDTEAFKASDGKKRWWHYMLGGGFAALIRYGRKG